MSLFSTLFCTIMFFSFLLPFLCQQNGSGAVIFPFFLGTILYRPGWTDASTTPPLIGGRSGPLTSLKKRGGSSCGLTSVSWDGYHDDDPPSNCPRQKYERWLLRASPFRLLRSLRCRHPRVVVIVPHAQSASHSSLYSRPSKTVELLSFFTNISMLNKEKTKKPSG